MKDNRDLDMMQLEAEAYVAKLLQEYDMMMQGARAQRSAGAQRGEQWQEETQELEPIESSQEIPI